MMDLGGEFNVLIYMKSYLDGDYLLTYQYVWLDVIVGCQAVIVIKPGFAIAWR
jgi:hypothetical protein